MRKGTLMILKLLKRAVEFYNRPVNYGDLFAFSMAAPDFPDFNRRRIREDIKRLVNFGEVIKAGNSDEPDGGRFVYLPAGNVCESLVSQTNAPVQIVENGFKSLWAARIIRAETEGIKPQPILTNDLYHNLAANNIKFSDKRTLPNTLLHLAKKSNPIIRRVERKGERFAAWVPANVPDGDLNLSSIYASDIERVENAVKRACAKFGRAVNAAEVQEEIDKDSNLRLNGEASLAVQLNLAAKEKAYINGKLVSRHNKIAVRRSGTYKGKAYYFYGTKKDEICYLAFTEFLNLKHRWEKKQTEKQLQEIEGCRLPSVAAGRALLVTAEAKNILEALDKLIDSNYPLGEIDREAKMLREETITTLQTAEEWIKTKGIKDLDIPIEVDTYTAGLTARELLPIVKPFYPAARSIEDPNKLITLLYNDIRRIPNPNFTKRFGRNHKETCSFLFDKTAALLFIAHNWGGPECNFQANLVSAELGNLRDFRFIVPALKSESYEDRLSAVACLAFIQIKEGEAYLRKIIAEDSDPFVRQAAIWAYAFSAPDNYKEFLEHFISSEKNENVRNFAQTIIETSAENLWLI